MKRAAIMLLLCFSAAAAQQKADAPGTHVDLQYLMAPLLDGDGKLTGYAYIVARLTTASDTDTLIVRDKMAFIQDALVRDVNARTVTTFDDLQKVDVPAVEARMLADVRKIAGSARVKALTICTVQIAPLHLTQTPSLAAPDARRAVDDHGNPLKSRCDAAKPT